MFKVLAASTLVLVTVLSVAAEESRYRLRSGDTIELNFVYVPEFNQTLTIQPDGYITLRGIGDVRADGRSMPELKKEIESRYSEIARAWQRSKAFGKGGSDYRRKFLSR